MKKTIHIQYGENDIHERLLIKLKEMGIIEFDKGGNYLGNTTKKFGTLVVEFIED